MKDVQAPEDVLRLRIIYEDETAERTGHWHGPCLGLRHQHSHNFQNREKRERNINYDYEGCQPYPWMAACLLFVTHNILLILCQCYSDNLSLIHITLSKRAVVVCCLIQINLKTCPKCSENVGDVSRC